MEAFAAFTAQTDHEVGRVLDALEDDRPARQHADPLGDRRQRRLDGRDAERRASTKWRR